MATNTYTGLRGALIQGIEASPLALPYSIENAPFDKPEDKSPWASVFVITNQPSVATLGQDGQDSHTGIMQVDLSYELLTGEAAVNAKADELSSFFTAGKRFAYQGIEVTISSCGRSRGREVNGWWRVSMTIAWFARVTRN